MRHLVTFIVRLWVDPETSSPGYEGQVECVATCEQKHVRSSEDILSFIETRLNPVFNAETTQEGNERQITKERKRMPKCTS